MSAFGNLKLASLVKVAVSSRLISRMIPLLERSPSLGSRLQPPSFGFGSNAIPTADDLRNLLASRRARSMTPRVSEVELDLRQKLSPLVGSSAGEARRSYLGSPYRRPLKEEAESLSKRTLTPTHQQEAVVTSGRHRPEDVLPAMPHTGLDRGRLGSDSRPTLDQAGLDAAAARSSPDYVFRGGSDGRVHGDARVWLSQVPEVANGYARPGEKLYSYRTADFPEYSLSQNSPHNGAASLNHPLFERIARAASLPNPVAEHRVLPSGRLMRVRGPTVFPPLAT